jgi:hypothetical protein
VQAGDDLAIIATAANGAALLAREGSSAPGEDGEALTGVKFSGLADPITGQNDDVAFFATLSGTKVNALNDSGLWYAPEGASPRLVARTGQPATGGGKWRRFLSVVLPEGGGHGPVFEAMLGVDPAEQIGMSGRHGLWAVDASGEPQLLLRARRALTVDGISRVVADFVALQSTATSRGAASGYAGNAVAVKVSFTDGTQEVVQFTLP